MKRIIFTLALACAVLPVYDTFAQGTVKKAAEIVAHRGYWKCDGSAQNSLTALQKSADIPVWGCELDVNLTADDVLVVNHDFNIGSVMIAEKNYDAIKDHKLSNGETLPTLESYLELASRLPDLNLVFELKSKGDSLYEARAVPMCVDMIKKYNLQGRTMFISFSFTACQMFAKLLPDNDVAYLGGELSPEKVKEGGVKSIDYHYSCFNKHPDWVKEAHDLGMSVNIWTVNDAKIIKKALEMGVDYITTNEPVMAKRMAEEFIAGQRQ